MMKWEEPKLIVNDFQKSRKVLSTIISELRSCDFFRFYVAFVNQQGVMSLLQTLIELEDKSVHGQVLVSDYLNFTEPNALRKLVKLSNVELRMMTNGNMHSKGYFFSRSNLEKYIIGSSNWTASALSKNTELNVLIEADPKSSLAEELDLEFKSNFEISEIVDEKFIKRYDEKYNYGGSEEGSDLVDLNSFSSTIRPNKMQEEALASLVRLRESGEVKALLISATGTGKTYLSAFDAKASNAKKLLFIVHRETIAMEALRTFKMIFKESRTYGMYSGGTYETHADFLFSTVQTLSRINRLQALDPDQFDYIIIDESHRSSANTYQNVLNYFRPKFLLGMTATPERMDGADIFKLFGYNVAYEIRLQKALEEEMLCPFHYFGISDIALDGMPEDNDFDFNQLTSDERVDKIIEKSNKYGCYDGVLRGLIFCSRAEEARQLSDKLCERGFRVISLTGQNTEEEREEGIRRLEKDPNDPNKLDYIITVDIFNEGVDIPSLNQIIMLRPTQSAIIFVQQLGRGLRKLFGKNKYLTVIDFIGNYNNNYLIPIALFGDRSFDKDEIRRLLVSGNEGVPGTSTINFDLISQKKIFDSINSAKLGKFNDLKEAYKATRNRIGRIPMMMDFINNGGRDPSIFINSKKSFYSFSRQIEADLLVDEIKPNALKILEIYSRYILNGKRLEDALIVLELIDNQFTTYSKIIEKANLRTVREISFKNIEHSVHCLNLKFDNTGNELIHFSLVKNDQEDLKWSHQFDEIKCPNFIKYLRDLAQYAVHSFRSSYSSDLYRNGFVIGKKYNRRDVFRILRWEKNPNPQNVGGYMISQDTNKSNCPIFVTYHKDEDISATTQYEDQFLSPSIMQWFSKSRRTLDSPDVKYINSLNSDQRMPLFVKKDDDEGKSFYFLGDVTADPNSFSQEYMNDDDGNQIPVVKLNFNLKDPVPESLYEYLVQ